MNNSRSKNQDTGLTLSDATQFSRKALLVIGIVIVTYTVLRMFFIAAVNYYQAMNPPPPPPPTVGFGRLPIIIFPEQDEKVWPKEFVLETARNRLPEFPDRAKVFSMQMPAPSLLADERARNLASRYGFNDQPEMLSPTHYRWIKYQPLEAIFEVNLVNFNFSLRTDYQTRSELLTSREVPDKHDAVQAVRSFLRKSDSLPEDIATASGDISYKRTLAGELMPAVSLSDANFVQVDIDRTPIDGDLRMFSPKGQQGIVSAVVTGVLRGDEQIVQMEYYHQKVEYSLFHTYPLKPIAQAWAELQANQGFVASGEALEEAVIREVTLGYFDSFEDQPFLQPVYVFSGDDDFMAYVSAIDSSYVVIQ